MQAARTQAYFLQDKVAVQKAQSSKHRTSFQQYLNQTSQQFRRNGNRK